MHITDAGYPTVAPLDTSFGREFIPPLNEGSLLYMPVMMPKTGLKEIQRVMSWQDTVIAATPEVASVAGKLGRFETATDPAPTEMLETTIMLKPEYIPNGRWRMKRNPAWREGMTVEKLKAELHELKTVQRPWVINAIAEARAQGDLSENAEYEAAKDRQGFIEGRIKEVEGKLGAAQVLEPTAFAA